MPETIIQGTKRFYQVLNPNGRTTIVFIHGHPFDHTMWLYQVEELQDFGLVLPDFRGYGQSEIGTGDIYIEEQALDTALLLDSLEIEPVHLMGLSMGGQIIVEFAPLFPHRTLSLVICDSNPAGESNETFNRRLQLAQSVQQVGMKKHTDDTVEKYLHPRTKQSNPNVFRHLHKMMSETTTEGPWRLIVAEQEGKIISTT